MDSYASERERESSAYCPSPSIDLDFVHVDRTLTAIAQLSILRLNVQRATIVLHDHTCQYVLAEATQNDPLVLNTAAQGNKSRQHSDTVSRQDTIERQCLSSTCSSYDNVDGRYNTSGLIVNDSQADDHFRKYFNSSSENAEGSRFYVGLPLISRSGHAAGVYAIRDEAPRQGLTVKELRFLEECAQCATEHLEWARDRAEADCSNKIVQEVAYLTQPTRKPYHDKMDVITEPNRKLQESLRAHTDGQSSCHGAAIFGVERYTKTNTDAEPNHGGQEGQHATQDTSFNSGKLLAYHSTNIDTPTHGINLIPALLNNIQLYAKAFLEGKTMYFTADDDTHTTYGEMPIEANSDAEGSRHNITKIKIMVFLPMYDTTERNLLAGCFLWTTTECMRGLDRGLLRLQAYSDCVADKIVQNSRRADASESKTLMSSISHELRSPLHGILVSAHLLMDNLVNSYQTGLLTSIVTCGQTLLDTLNHVLDYNKLNSFPELWNPMGRVHPKHLHNTSSGNHDSLTSSSDVDLAELVEEVVASVTARHYFRDMSESRSDFNIKRGCSFLSKGATDSKTVSSIHGDQGVRVILDSSPHQSWRVNTQPGAIRRLIMNLVGNAFKFTTSGAIFVSLTSRDQSLESHINAQISNLDTGIGMSAEFLRDHLYGPFQQADPFGSGTGLGMTMVDQIVKSLQGSVEIRSQPGVGTEINVHLCLPLAEDSRHITSNALHAINHEFKGKHVVILDSMSDEEKHRMPESFTRREAAFRKMVTEWFGMFVSASSAMDTQGADYYVYSEPPSADQLLQRHREVPDKRQSSRETPLIIFCTTAEEANSVNRDHRRALIEAGRIVEVVAQPCGPRKFAKVLNLCNDKARRTDIQDETEHTPRDEDQPPEESDMKESQQDMTAQQQRNSSEHIAGSEEATINRSESHDASSVPQHESSSDMSSEHPVQKRRTQLRGLLVDDNKINLKLLTMFMKKQKYTYVEAENGQEALQAYKSACKAGSNSNQSQERFDFVLMDINMPVMDGLDATKGIREFEQAESLSNTRIFALTVLGSNEMRSRAFAAGVNEFLPKPLQFSELKALLETH
ncbi:hypothetical protein K431DRAFT_349267 [Polychaeton citri CBS 116435]|uniref:Histidine kinase n=1 Tax=Polychaeton citri CBS 116435 TaxID=1314669 RepID=A0A9P4Q1J6_9PEZI|nr:hypothetical protein K431DRAFT_349267 [Polychaeton citri CBS 116435]